MILNVPFEFFVAVAKLDMPESGKEVAETSDTAKVVVVQKFGTTTQAGKSN